MVRTYIDTYTEVTLQQLCLTASRLEKMGFQNHCGNRRNCYNQSFTFCPECLQLPIMQI